MNRNTFLKVLALTLAFMLVFSCAGLSAFAEDFSTGDVQYLIVRPSANDSSAVWVEAIGKDGEEIWKVEASGATVKTGDVASDVRYAPSVEVTSDKNEVMVSTGDVNNDADDYQAVVLTTTGNDAKIEYESKDIASGNDGLVINSNGGNVIAKADAIYSDDDSLVINSNGGNVIAEADAIYSDDDGLVIENNGGSINAKAGIIESGARGVQIESTGGSVTADLTTVSADDIGVYISCDGGIVNVKANAISSVDDGVAIENNGGNVTVTAGTINALDWGVNIQSGKNGTGTGTTAVNVNGDISSDADKGIIVQNYDDGYEDSIAVNGNITVTGNITDKETSGVRIEAVGDVDFAMTGNVAVITDDGAEGVHLGSMYLDDATECGTIDATLTGNIDVTGQAAEGVELFAINDGTVNFNMTGNISATATTQGNNIATALDVLNNGGTINAQIKGNLASSEDGISLYDASTALVDADPDAFAEYDSVTMTVNEEELETVKTGENGKEQKTYVHVDGDILVYYDENGKVIDVKKKVEKESSDTMIEVTGNVTAPDTGIFLNVLNDKAKVDIIVDGTVNGESQSVLLARNTVTDNLTLTLWEVKPNEKGNLVERMTYLETTEGNVIQHYGADEALEKSIQYIIRIEPTQTNIISTAGTTDYEGYHVAKEGETVTLKLNVPAGYRVANAFNGTTEKVQLLQDANGEYYLVVPRGGGVMLSVQLVRIPKPTPPKPDPDPDPDPDPEEVEEKATESIVVFNLNGGTLDGKTGSITVKARIGEMFELLGAPEREGYDFAGWNVQEVAQDDPAYKEPGGDAEVKAAGAKIEITGEHVTVNAIWKKK